MIKMHCCAFAKLVAIGLASGLPFCSQALAETCERSLTNSIHEVERAVDSVTIERADPVATQRNNEHFRWMHDELELIREACSRGRDVEAAWRLEEVQRRMKIIGQSLPARTPCRVMARTRGNCTLAAVPQTVKR
jgi:hypothetical protein